ncbi:uncharacterized protein E0L32_011948 [Thyridium curvatum]|uniref:Diphthine--ammonia ligase n=1 Tax=Thyridium curvatum TaxID=1093900 RepID=A0A507BML7_9PEZI|nr:uncharacterized protein E0L32_011948 [Thyridium curvatum]TPX17980.1 hypothetical protein E0L32_011948 [Thyridium curvatum]
MADSSATAAAAPPPVRASAPPGKGLNVIALVSGGKDSFYSALHCLAHGHRLVALANLYPARAPADGSPAVTAAQSSSSSSSSSTTTKTTVVLPAAAGQGAAGSLAVVAGGSTAGQAVDGQGPTTTAPGQQQQQQGDEDEAGLNSFMYQTVGHQVLPLYAAATGLPLYRHPIVGGALQSAREYADPSTLSGPASSSPQTTRQEDPGSSSLASPPSAASSPSPHEGDQHAPANQSPAAAVPQQKGTPADHAPAADETESMVPLLEAVMRAHPEANALCSGAILSTYQRTRVESVATRLGLVPLAFLWKFPALPGAGGDDDDEAQLLHDMEAAGLRARVVRVASGGLDESFLWEEVTGRRGVERVRRAVGRYGAPELGAVIGEGGEFETLVLDGPRCLFRDGRIAVRDEDREVVSEGGGTYWLRIRGASVEAKPEGGAAGGDAAEELVRIPELFDGRFEAVMAQLSQDESRDQDVVEEDDRSLLSSDDLFLNDNIDSSAIFTPSCFVAEQSSRSSIEEETRSIVTQIRSFLREHSLQPLSITNTVVVLRDMADFPAINAVYGALFPDPNPPSRVTISCGDRLPRGVGIAVFLSVHRALERGDRQGLHVQSRSYWAPANIGPYSQAVSVPVASLLRGGGGGSREGQQQQHSSGGARLVAIAGQIPLVPATMELPAPEQDSFSLQLVLALQHLWRVGAEVGVQWWSSAVAYVPRQAPALRERAVLAGRAWRAAHRWSKDGKRDDDDDDDDDEEPGGPDLWDRTFDTRYRSYAAAESEAAERRGSLPDYGVLARPCAADQRRPVPPVFVAEVEQLPRSAQVEWHAHLGFAGAGAGRGGTVRTATYPLARGAARRGGVAHTTLEDGDGAAFVQTVVWWEYPDAAAGEEPLVASELDITDEDDEDGLRMGRDGMLGGGKGARLSPCLVPELVYVDARAFSPASAGEQQKMEEEEGAWVPGGGALRTPVVPCFSLWKADDGDDGARRLGAVVVYRGVVGGCVWGHCG